MRQVKRWTQQYIASKTDELDAMDRLMTWLPAHLPDDDPTTIAHGDYRLGNMIFHPHEPRVVAILDWELSTLGHPYADLAYNCLSYHVPNLVRGDLLAADLDELDAGAEAPGSFLLERSVYVPIYSHVYYQSGRPYLLEATLSVRNTNLDRPVFVRSVRYYDSHGNLVKDHLDRLIRLDPLETVEFLVKEHDIEGGSGANFVVDWSATEQVNEPLIEAVMVGAVGTQGIAFRTEGKNLLTPDNNGD